MEANVISIIAEVVEHSPVPFHVAPPVGTTRTARDQLQTPVGVLHHFRGLLGADGILVGRHVAKLPRAVHLVAQAPEVDSVRLPIAILHPVARFLGRAGAKVNAEHRRPIKLPAELDKFVGAKLIRFNALPGEFANNRPLRARADTVFPVIAGRKVAAGIAHRGVAQPAQGIEDIAPATVGIRVAATGFVDAFVDGSTHVFEEPAKEAFVNGSDCETGVQLESRSFHLGI